MDKELKTWTVLKDNGAKEIPEKLDCGQSIIPVTYKTLFHLAKARNPTWVITNEVFYQLNVGPLMSEGER